jgi:hypothetical protein
VTDGFPGGAGLIGGIVESLLCMGSHDTCGNQARTKNGKKKRMSTHRYNLLLKISKDVLLKSNFWPYRSL